MENIVTSLPLVLLPDPRLTQPSEDVDFSADPVDQWVRDMTKTMHDNQGIGLAACQVGIMKRLTIVDVGLIRSRGASSEIAVFINPTVVWSSEERVTHEEGCLSIPGFSAEVERPQRVRVSYRNIKNEACTLEADDFVAVCLQHEIDHLNGILFISYLSPLKRKRVLARFNKANKAKNQKSKPARKKPASA